MFHWKKQNKKVCAEMSRQTMYYSNDKMDSGKQIAIWFIPCTLLVCTYLQPSILLLVNSLCVRTIHLIFYFSAPISCSMPIVKNIWDIPYYTMLYYLDIIALITLLNTYCAFVIQINYSNTFEFPYFHWILETI